METDSFPFKLTNNYYHLKRWLGKRIQDRWYYPPKRLLGATDGERRAREFLISFLFSLSLFFSTILFEEQSNAYKLSIIKFDVKLLLSIRLVRSRWNGFCGENWRIDSFNKRGLKRKDVGGIESGWDAVLGSGFWEIERRRFKSRAARWWMKNHLEKKQ